MSKQKILVIAQTPPPFHGQAVMQKYLVDVKWDWCNKQFVRMNFSNSIDEVGTFRTKKLTQLFHLIGQVFKSNAHRARVIYYPPSGPNRVGIYRDVIMLFLLKVFSGRVLLHFHAGGINQIFDKVTGVEAFFIKRAFRKPIAAIVLTRSLQNEILWCKPEKTFVVENGIEDVFPRFSRKSTQPNNVITFLFVGNLKKEKGIFTLLESAAFLMRTGEKFKINFVGGFHAEWEKQQFFEYIESNNLNDIVKYVGVRTGDEKWLQFQIADVFCLPTYETEAMPISILEAMMFQLPTISTNWRSIPDIIRHEKNGLLFEPGNANSLAACMRRLIHSESERSQLAIQARNDYVERYTVAQHLNKMEKVFREVVDAK